MIFFSANTFTPDGIKDVLYKDTYLKIIIC